MNASSRIRSLLALATTGLCLLLARAAEPALPFASEIAAFKAADARHAPPIGAVLFIGSSSIVKWRTLADDFAGHDVINRGFGGSQISDVLLYPDDIVFPYRPRAIVFYCGGNDIHLGKSPERVFSDFKSFVETVHKTLPKTKIYFISIAPNPSRFAEVGKVRRANKLIEEFCGDGSRRTEFIDIFPLMLQPDGSPRPELYVADRLHMTPAGYAVWTSVVRKAVFGGP
jgi:lysophospholipase L1-like esterase